MGKITMVKQRRIYEHLSVNPKQQVQLELVHKLEAFEWSKLKGWHSDNALPALEIFSALYGSFLSDKMETQVSMVAG